MKWSNIGLACIRFRVDFIRVAMSYRCVTSSIAVTIQNIAYKITGSLNMIYLFLYFVLPDRRKAYDLYCSSPHSNIQADLTLNSNICKYIYQLSVMLWHIWDLKQVTFFNVFLSHSSRYTDETGEHAEVTTWFKEFTRKPTRCVTGWITFPRAQMESDIWERGKLN